MYIFYRNRAELNMYNSETTLREGDLSFCSLMFIHGAKLIAKHFDFSARKLSSPPSRQIFGFLGL